MTKSGAHAKSLVLDSVDNSEQGVRGCLTTQTKLNICSTVQCNEVYSQGCFPPPLLNDTQGHFLTTFPHPKTPPLHNQLS